MAPPSGGYAMPQPGGPGYGAPGGYAPAPGGAPAYGGGPGTGAPPAPGGYGAQPAPGGGGYGPAPGVAPQAVGPNVVTVQNHAYAPATLTVRTGTTVRWVNRDAVAHSATGSGFDVEIPANGEGSFTFSTAGTYEVRCRYHPRMQGRVVVTP
jgi:plastocyanin